MDTILSLKDDVEPYENWEKPGTCQCAIERRAVSQGPRPGNADVKVEDSDLTPGFRRARVDTISLR
jgi:hypothetical protein